MGMFNWVEVPKDTVCVGCSKPLTKGWQTKDGEEGITVPYFEVNNFYNSCPHCNHWNEWERQRTTSVLSFEYIKQNYREATDRWNRFAEVDAE